MLQVNSGRLASHFMRCKANSDYAGDGAPEAGDGEGTGLHIRAFGLRPCIPDEGAMLHEGCLP